MECIKDELSDFTVIEPSYSIPFMISEVSEFLLQGNNIAVLTDDKEYVYAMRFYFASPIIQKTNRRNNLSLSPDYTFTFDIGNSLRSIISDLS